MTRTRWLLAIGTLVAFAALWLALPAVVESIANGIADHPPYAIDDTTRALHRSLTVADLHADPLLWGRDLREWGARGHVDLPRMRAGNVAIQVMSVVTQVPLNQSYEQSENIGDAITALAVVGRWPLRTWSSIRGRALHQAAALDALAASATRDLRVLHTRADVEAVLAARAEGGRLAGALLAIEGAQPLEGDLGNLRVLWDAGFRMLGLQHFFDNRLGGSLHGAEAGGLSEFGRAVVHRADASGWIIDLAHSSPAVVDDVLELGPRALVVSHTGMRGHCDHPRNLRDERMRRIAAAGGLVGIGFWGAAACDTSPAGVVRALRYAIDVLGVDHVALGSDYDGATTVSFDASELAALTQQMLRQDFGEDEIRKVMGANVARLLRERLPGR